MEYLPALAALVVSIAAVKLSRRIRRRRNLLRRLDQLAEN